MQNLPNNQNTTRASGPSYYTDEDINGLLDTIARLRDDNCFLVRKLHELEKIATAMKLQIMSQQHENQHLIGTIQYYEEQLTHLRS
jgi:hypothetical protein